MKRSSGASILAVLLAFAAGMLSHWLYQRWNPTSPASERSEPAPLAALESPSFRVSYLPAPTTPAAANPSELATIVARDVEKIRSFTGQQARIRGRVFRVGHSAKSNTYFINFGPSREALTAVIFSSAAELFEKSRQSPKQFENREVEIVGFIKDHPQYGLELIIENPKQIRIVN